MNEKFLIELKAKIDTGQTAVNDLNKQIKEMEGKIQSLELKVNSSNLNKTNQSMKNFDKTVNNNRKNAGKWKYSWEQAFQSFTTFRVVQSTLDAAFKGIQQMVNEVINLDDKLTELKKVTDLEGDSLKQFTKKAYESAKEVAKTGSEMIEASTEFAKAGYDSDTSLELGKVALMYTNIADETISASEASSFMIAQMKAFNIEAEDSMHIIDAVNEVANNFAVSSADIANNLGKSSAVMANAGNTYEQMIGLN